MESIKFFIRTIERIVTNNLSTRLPSLAIKYHFSYISDIMNIIRASRLRAGLTQQELARRAGITQPAIARIESGRVVPRMDTAARLLRACGMRLEAVPAAGTGIDRSTIRKMLVLTPAERLAIATEEARNIASLTRR